MRYKFLLLFLLMSYGVFAQDTIRSLVITEARLDRNDLAYVELTNMGTESIDLSQFEFGRVGAWTAPTDKWSPVTAYMMLPAVDLAPGESYVIGVVEDWRPVMERRDPYYYGYRASKEDMQDLVDLAVHYRETSSPGDVKDSISPFQPVFEVWNGRDCWYLRQHISSTDSVVVDQVNGIFDQPDGTRVDGPIDVAGVTNATYTCVLVRKNSVKQGNVDFASGRGQDLAESEWIPVPQLGPTEGRRASFWTVGNQGDYVLDENTLESNTIDVNLTDAILTVPWGVRRDDSLMFQFKKKPGIAWHYDYVASHEDSAYISARTGDELTVYVCGNTLMKETFTIHVSDPKPSDNIVVAKKVPNEDGFYTGMEGIFHAFCYVTDGAPGMDTIMNTNAITGIPFATRTDTLLKYLEKPPKATWEFVWVDGVERADLKNGDILKVTAEDGSEKEYFIKVDGYRPDHNADLSAITWPDIPEFYQGLFGWKGDTIPNFSPANHNYVVQVPFDVDGIPALVATPEALNTKVDVQRATNLFGTDEDRTVTFTSTAEDDTTVRVYKVMLQKELADSNIQPWHGEPFISQFVWRDQWANVFMEVVNPGTAPLDMSHYMFCFGYHNTPAEAISANSGAGDWDWRYGRYIPGYKWQDSTNWKVEPAIAIQDLNVNPIVQPKDVFVMGDIRSTGQSGYPWFASEQCDIDFAHNPWGEEVKNGTALQQWNGANWYLFRIDNDSILQGLKPATDPNDFTLIDVFGSGDGSPPVVGGKQIKQVISYDRKPGIYKGQPEFRASFGTDPESSEWTWRDRDYYDNLGVGWPDDILLVCDGLGSHFMDPVTVYKSTVTSLVYKVSLGYSDHETIRGVVTGTTVGQFLGNIIKADEDQALILKSVKDGSELPADSVLTNGDSLIVISADTTNTSKYILEVTDQGLSDNAVLTSDVYTIEVDKDSGSVTGFDYGTLLKTVRENVTVPPGATLTIIDEDGAYVPLKRLNYDTTYVDVEVNDQTFFEVVAEDGKTKITYKLVANHDETTALITSSVYSVDQDALLVEYIPMGTTVSTFLKNITPSEGATVKIIDKMGMERTSGYLVMDDKVVVTAPDGVTTNTYYLSMLGYELTNLAYIQSDVYTIDQVTLTVYVIEGATAPTVDEFTGNLTPAPGATLEVTDANGNTKAGTDETANGDIVIVTSANGANVVSYKVTFITGIGQFGNADVKIYPNPTTGMVHISGLDIGMMLHVYNSVGVKVLEKVVFQSDEELSLENRTRGLYFITITDKDGNVMGRYKLILK